MTKESVKKVGKLTGHFLANPTIFVEKFFELFNYNDNLSGLLVLDEVGRPRRGQGGDHHPVGDLQFARERPQLLQEA